MFTQGMFVVDPMIGRPVGRRQSFGAPAERGPKGPDARERNNDDMSMDVA